MTRTWNGRGESNVNAKLTTRQIRAIRVNAEGFTNKQLAVIYGVNPSYIGRIRRREVRHFRSDAKLSPAKAKEIRRLHESGLSQREIARRFGVSHMTVSFVVRGITWK